MKKTSNELLEFFGLKVGDKIKVDGYDKPFVIFVKDGEIFAKRENGLSSWNYYNTWTLTDVLLNCEYEIVKPKKIGEMKCSEMACKDCPLRTIDCDINSRTLNEALEKFIEDLNSFNSSLKPFEKALIDAIKVELDRDVKE